MGLIASLSFQQGLLGKQKAAGHKHPLAESSVAQDSLSAKKSGHLAAFPPHSVVPTSSIELQDLHSVAKNVT